MRELGSGNHAIVLTAPAGDAPALLDWGEREYKLEAQTTLLSEGRTQK